jgi:hypothetical protein
MNVRKLTHGRDGGARQRGELRLGGSKLTKNAACEVFINFIMSMDRLTNLGLWLLIPVVLSAVPDEEGPSLFYFFGLGLDASSSHQLCMAADTRDCSAKEFPLEVNKVRLKI